MKARNKALLNRFRKFFESISPEDRVAVIHHTDPDGVCSGVIVSKLVERLRGRKIDLRHNQKGNIHFITPQTYRKLKSRKINKVVITDLAVDDFPELVKRIEKFADILILDHHPIYHNLNSKKVVMVKPQMFCDVIPNKYPASKLSYDLGSMLTDLSDLDWVAAIGLIGDIATEPWNKWIKNVFKKYKISMNKDFFKTKLGEASIIISSAESYDVKNVKLCFALMCKAKSYKDVLKSKLTKFRKVIDDELNYYIKNIKKLAVFEKDFIYYEVKPKYHSKSPLSTILGLKYPHKSVIIVDVRQNPVSVSARRKDAKVKINTVLERALKGIKGASAGGHIVSAGALIPRKDFQKFKIKLFKILKKGGE